MRTQGLPLNRTRIRALIVGGFTGVAGEGIKLWLGEPIAKWLNTLSGSAFYLRWVVPFAVGVLPLLAAIIAVAYVIAEDGKDTYESGPELGGTIAVQSPEIPEFSIGHSADLSTPGQKNRLLQELGIIDVTEDLRDSEFHPHKCMVRTRKHLMFMGILGSKWISDPGFESFTRRIQLVNGSLRFLLIHPEGRSFATLSELRQGSISTNSLSTFQTIRRQCPALRVKLYEDLPVFRLVFFDGQILALSRYKLDHDGYFESKLGWDAPHLVISSTPRWSLYETFEDYYNSIWNRSMDLDDYLASKTAVQITAANQRSKEE